MIGLSEHAQKTISKKEFTEKYQKIYEGIGVKNLNVKTKERMLKIKNFFFLKLRWIRMEEQLHLSMQAKLVKDKDAWKVDWTPDFIFPGMKKDYKYVCKQKMENARNIRSKWERSCNEW